MKTVYAIQFDICPHNGNTRASIVEIESLIVAWVRRKYLKTSNIDLDFDFNEATISPLAQHTLVMKVQESDDYKYSQFEWTHPDELDNSLFWKTSLSVCADNEKIEISVVVRIEAAKFIVKPITGYTFGRPGIVDDVLSCFDCKIADETIPTHFERITDNVASFVSNILEDPKRILPVIMLSQDVWTDSTFVDPEMLQKRLLGFARVIVIEKYAGFELTGLVGKQLSCYNGAIRIYWAGFSKESNPFSHQLYLEERLIDFKDQGSRIEWYLFRLLASVASLRYSEGMLSKKAILSFQNKRADEIARIRKELQENSLSVGEIEHELENSWNENERLQRELKESRDRIQELEVEIANHRENYRNMLEYQESAPLDSPAKAEPSEFDSVFSAVTEADNYFSKRSLFIWDSALESAEKSNFARPKEIFEALKAVTELGDIYFESLQSGESIGTWEQFFAARGFKYAPTDGEMTVNLYGKERIHSHQNERKQMLKHITIGGGDRTNCVQIYFEPNEANQKIEVGYCGMHLSYYTQRT